jgi:hypothetical protein
MTWGVYQIAHAPDIAGVPTVATDGLSAQQKIFEVIRRTGDGRSRAVSLSERELNAFLSRHLAESPDLPLRNLAVRLHSDGHADIAGLIPLRQLLASSPFSAIAAILHPSWLDWRVWLAVRARIAVDDTGGAREPRRLRVDVERFWLGRLRLPEVMLRVLLDPAALRLLRWPLPEAIRGVRVEPGRLVIQTGS